MTIRGLAVGESYIHFKYQTEYVIVGFSKSTDAECGINVLYTEKVNIEQYKLGNIIPWSRDISEFIGYKDIAGKMVKRFERKAD